MWTGWWICRYVISCTIWRLIQSFNSLIIYIFFITWYGYFCILHSFPVGIFLGYSMLQLLQYLVVAITLLKTYIIGRYQTTSQSSVLLEDSQLELGIQSCWIIQVNPARVQPNNINYQQKIETEKQDILKPGRNFRILLRYF